MNAQRGLTARKGGANDPSVIQNKLGAGKTAYTPGVTKPATPGAATKPAAPIPLPTAADRQGLAREPNGLGTAKMSAGSLSSTPIKNQDTGMRAAREPSLNYPHGQQYATSPEKTPVPATTAPSTSPTIPGSTAPRSGTSDTGGFMKGAPVDPTNALNKSSATTDTGKPAPETKASVSTAPEAPKPAEAPKSAEPSYSSDSPAGKAWANRGKFGGTQQEEKKMVAESFVSVGSNKYRIV